MDDRRILREMAKILRVDIKPTSTYTTYVPAKEVDIKSLDNTWDYYLLNQPIDEPIWYTDDINIYIDVMKFVSINIFI